jgi:hypothetical protein
MIVMTIQMNNQDVFLLLHTTINAPLTVLIAKMEAVLRWNGNVTVLWIAHLKMMKRIVH